MIALGSAGGHRLQPDPILDQHRSPPGPQQGPEPVQEVGQQLLRRAVLQQFQGEGLDLADHLPEVQGLRGLAATLRVRA